MLIEINYNIKYEYTQPVFLESNDIRIFPRNDLSQRLMDYKLEINPAPSNQTFFIDLENNTGLKVWFRELTDFFELDFTCRVETLRKNPYDYIVDFDKVKLPYEKTGKNITIQNFSDEIREKSNGEVLGFLSVLSEKIKSEFKYEIREEGLPFTAEKTLKNKSGSCRDFAILFIEACRCQGLQSRFVSGYMFDDDIKDKSYLHAWAEVYVPGGGWRGYDPVNGIASADRHIAIAASDNPLKVLPFIGSYRSNVGKSKMEYSLKLKTFSAKYV